jgi:hypothetical protein
VNVAQDRIVFAVFKGATEKPGILQIIQSDGAVALESERNEIEVLRDDRGRRAGKVEGK